MGTFAPRVFFPLLMLGLLCTRADAASYNFNHQCQLEHYNGKTWDAIPASMLQGRIRDPLTPRGDKRLFYLNKQWYRADAKCLTRNEIDPLAQISDRDRTAKKWAIDLSAGYALLMGERFQDRAVTTGGYITTTLAQKTAINFSLGVWHRLHDDLVLRYFVTRMTTSQDAVVSGSTSGSKADSHEFYHFGFGVTKTFPRGRFIPHLGLDLGYTMDSGLYTYTGFSGIFSGLNGGVDINAGGIFVGGRVGADYEIVPDWYVFSELIFQHSFLGEAKVKATTTTFYSADETVTAQPFSRLMLSVGVRYWL